MVSFRQLFGLAIISLCYDLGGGFQTEPLGNDQLLTEELRSLVGDAEFGYDKLLLTWCQNQHPNNVSLNLSNLGITSLPNDFISSQHVTCLGLQGNNLQENVSFNVFQQQPNLEYLNLAKNNFNLQKLLSIASHPKIKTLVLDSVLNYKRVPSNSYYKNRYYKYNDEYEYDCDNLDVLRLRLPNLENLSLQDLNPGTSHKTNLSCFDLTLTKLTHLFLSDNKIHQINDQFFNNLPNTLTHLFVERCNLESYSALVMNQTASLISLSMDGNSFSCSNGGCLDFEGHPELKYLSLADCKISAISHNTFSSNAKLVYLDMSRNWIQQLSERTFQKTPAMESLNLNDNQLLKIPNLHSLSNLKKLYLKGNKITNLDQDSFSSLENLQILSLSNNNIDYIDGSAFDNLLSLVVLDLSSNEISNLEYRTSFNLKYLILTNNSISSVDDIDLGNSTLKYLLLTDNPLINIQPRSLKFLSDNTTIVLKNPPNKSIETRICISEN